MTTPPLPAAAAPLSPPRSVSRSPRAVARRWVVPLAWGLALALLAAGAVLLAQRRGAVAQALDRLEPAALAIALAVVAASLALRAARWQAILLALGHRLPWPLQARTFLAGLALSPTPGKLGETSRGVWLALHGVPPSHGIAAFGADRTADVIGVALLGAGAAWWAGVPSPALSLLAAAGLLGAAGLAAALRQPRVLARFGAAAAAPGAERPPADEAAGSVGPMRPAGGAAGGGGGAMAGTPGAGAPHPTRDGEAVARRGWRAWTAGLPALALRPLAAWAGAWQGTPRIAGWVAVSVAAFGAQALVLHGFVDAVEPGTLGPARAAAIFAASILLGAASGVPGGIGTMDAALVWQLQGAGVSTEAALAATLATRLCTLGFGWLVGVAAWASFARGGPPAGEGGR